MKNIFYLILLITIGVNAQTYAPSPPILNGNVRITTPPTAQPANQPYIMLWGQNAPYNVLGKYLVSDLFTQFGTIPTFQQVLNAGSTANINTPFIVNYKLGTPQAVELSINDSNFQLGLPFYNNYLIFDDSQVIFNRNLSVPDAVNNNHAVNLGQLNSAFGNFVPYSGATDNVDLGDNNLIANSVQAKTITLFDPDSGNTKLINLGEPGLSAFALPTNDGTGTVGATKGGTTIYTGTDGLLNLDNLPSLNPNMQTTFNNGSQIDMNGGEVEYYNGQGFNIDTENVNLGANTPNSTTNLRSAIITANNLTENTTSTRFLVQDNMGRVYFRNGTTSTPTNLSYDANNRQVNNTNGTGFQLPFVTSTVGGLASPAIFNHILDTNNPHNTTKAQVGLGNVDNTSDANKPVSTAQQTAINAKVQNALTPASTTIAPSVDAVNTALALKQAVISGTGYAYWNGTTITWVTGSSNTLTQGNGNTVQKSQVVFNDASLPSVLSTPGLLTAGMSVLNITSTLYGNWIAMTSTSSKTANYTLTNMDYKVKLTSGTATFTLPTAVGIAGKEYVVKNSGTGVLTLATTASQTIDGMTTYPPINVQYKGVRVQSDGANWDIIGQF